MKSDYRVWLYLTRGVCLASLMTVFSCHSDTDRESMALRPPPVSDASADATSTDAGQGPNTPIPLEMFTRCPDYPRFNLAMGYDQVAPPIGWTGAYRADGERTPFSFEAFFCGERYAHQRTLVLFIGAGWCQSCARLIETYLNPMAPTLTEELGVELVYLELQDEHGAPADSQFARRHLAQLIGDGVGWRMGDLDTVIRQDGEMVPAPRFISQQANLPVLPAIWVIRKRDMRVIATRQLAWMARPGELPLTSIAMDPEADWSSPPLPPFQNRCGEGDEEETDETTNNVFEEATIIGAGVHTGGICDRAPDFYAFDLAGPWHFRLAFDPRQGDLDVVQWDPQRGRAALDTNGRIIGSFNGEGVEALRGEGSAIVQVRGYGGASAAYTITLEAL